jgi:hypothetical protein
MSIPSVAVDRVVAVVEGDELPDDKIKKIEDARRQSSEIVSIASTMKESGGIQAGINAEKKNSRGRSWKMKNMVLRQLLKQVIC